jgi:hypothetical protein
LALTPTPDKDKRIPQVPSPEREPPPGEEAGEEDEDAVSGGGVHLCHGRTAAACATEPSWSRNVKINDCCRRRCAFQCLLRPYETQRGRAASGPVGGDSGASACGFLVTQQLPRSCPPNALRPRRHVPKQADSRHRSERLRPNQLLATTLAQRTKRRLLLTQ